VRCATIARVRLSTSVARARRFTVLRPGSEKVCV
jgi:hypothetical protein